MSPYFNFDPLESLYELFDVEMKWIQEGAIFFQVILVPTGAIFRGTSHEIKKHNDESYTFI